MEQYQLENLLVALNKVAFTTEQLHKVLVLNGFKITRGSLEELLAQYFLYYAIKSAKYYWRTGDESKTVSTNQLNKLLLQVTQ
jgi:hypothetical protein